MNIIRFIDCNYPGVVYTGTEDHMRGLGFDGGCPSKLEGTSRIPDEDCVGGFWREVPAPDHWVMTVEQEAAAIAKMNESR